MGEVYISGHGGYDASQPWVLVPPGRTVLFYADMDMGSPDSTGSIILNAGNVSSREEYSAENKKLMPNYDMSAVTDDLIVNSLASVSSRLPGRLYLVGVDEPVNYPELRMCTQPDACNARDPERRHLRLYGCEGLFALFPEAGTRLHLLICRLPYGSKNPDTLEVDVRMRTQKGLERDGKLVLRHGKPVMRTLDEPISTSLYGDSPIAFYEDQTSQIFKIYKWAARDPQAAMAYVGSLSQATLANLRGVAYFAQWLEVMRHPISVDSSPDAINALAKSIAAFRANDTTWALLFWEALPDVTRQALVQEGWPLMKAFLIHNNIEFGALNNLVQGVADYFHTAPTPPRDFLSAWGDTDWRNVFWRWIIDVPHSHPNPERLIQLFQLLQADHPHAASSPAITAHPDVTLTRVGDLHYFFTHDWTNPPEDLAGPVAELAHLWDRINAVPRRLDPYSPTTASYLVEYRRIRKDALDPAYAPPLTPDGTVHDADHPDPAALAADRRLNHWTWAHSTREYPDLTEGEQAELSAWVYDDLGTFAFDELPDHARREYLEIAEGILDTLNRVTYTHLAILYRTFQRQYR